MRLVIISGRSGSGKSTALQALEDAGFYCVDNLPVALLPSLAASLEADETARMTRVAVGIDARNVRGQLEHFPEMLQALKPHVDSCETLFLDAGDETLLKRFSATRRRHPLSGEGIPLGEALAIERTLLEPISLLADLVMDTSQLSVHGLRDLVRDRIVGKSKQHLTLLVESFGFKNGVPPDADFVFDVRCLPNPYWEPHLRAHTGLETGVVAFLDAHDSVQEMLSDISRLLVHWLPHFEKNDRQYMTVAVGCTGGYHRSVYIVERLAIRLRDCCHSVLVRHRELAAQEHHP